MSRVALGWCLTAAWIALYLYLSGKVSPHAMSNMSPNEWGDWAAGLAAPIAFLWLVLGYFQQGEELRSNVQALRLQERALQLQVRELSESVQQQTVMAKASAEQVKLAEKAQLLAIYQQVQQHQPAFGGFVPWQPQADRVTVAIQNVGATCFNAKVTLPLATPGQSVDDGGPGHGGGQPWLHSAERAFTFVVGEQESPAILRFAISYQDSTGTNQTQTFRLEIPSWPPPEGLHLMATRESFGFVMPTIESLVEKPK